MFKISLVLSLTVFLFFSSCKKDASCTYQTIASGTCAENFDTTTKYQLLIGRWYLRVIESDGRHMERTSACFVANMESIEFLSDRTINMYSGNQLKRTFPLSLITDTTDYPPGVRNQTSILQKGGIETIAVCQNTLTISSTDGIPVNYTYRYVKN